MVQEQAKRPLNEELQEAVLVDHERRINQLENEMANIKAYLILKGVVTLEG